MRGDVTLRVEAPGGAVAGRYRLLRPLGAGSSSTVWAAVDETLGRQVALKLLSLSAAAAADPRERERLRREAQALAALDHPHIVTVFDYLETAGEDGGVQPVLVTELLDGQSLAARLGGRPLPRPEALSVCGQIADALAATHGAGIVHRDVKPANVFLTAAGAKLLDFGLAQDRAQRGPDGGRAFGTPVCMAPEQLTGRGALPASDVYALGCVIYWTLTGLPPFRETDFTFLSHAHLHGTPPPLAIEGLPPGIEGLYLACMAKNPSQRPTADEVFEVLAPFTRKAAKRAPTVTDQTTQFLPVVGEALAESEEEPPDDTPRTPAKHAGRASGLDRRRLLPVGLLLGALAVITLLMLGLAHSITGGPSAAPGATSPSTHAGVGAGGASAAATSTVADVVLPSGSATASASAFASQTPTAAQGAIPPLTVPASNPIGYLQGMAGQISAMVAQGPNTLQPNAGQNLSSAIAQLQNLVGSAQQNGAGKKQLHNVLNGISATEQLIAQDASSGQASPAAANLLTGELQRLSAQLSGSNGNGD